MSASDPIQITFRRSLLFSVWLLTSVLANVCMAGPSNPDRAALQANIASRSIRLPIVNATDNRFVRLSTSEGLSQTKVDHIAQDDQGFMWFGTQYGLYRYDGYAFEGFVQDSGEPKSLDDVKRSQWRALGGLRLVNE